MKYCPVCENDYPDEVTVCPLDGATVRRPGTRSDPFIGRVIHGRYRVERQLGEGGMGTVYLAEQLSIGRKVALKVLRGEFARDDSFVTRFRQEAQLVAALNDTRNPHVTLVHDFDQAEDGSLFIVMEYLEGRVLNQLIQRETPLGLPRAVRLAAQIAEGLEAAHRAGVIHRDIKPQNIMVLDANDDIKLMDFGIARLRDSRHPGLTRVGTMMGTPEYMAPEQIEGQDVSERTDIYAFGIVFYEMLTGVVPFRANTPAAVLTRQLREEPAPPTRLRPNIPPEIEALVLCALAKNPDHRQRDMGEIARALSHLSRRLTEAPADEAAPMARTGGPLPAETIVIAPPPSAAAPPPASTVVAPQWPRTPGETSVPEVPVSGATVVIPDQFDGQSGRPPGAVRSRSRPKTVVIGVATGVAVSVVALAVWTYLVLSSTPRPAPAPSGGSPVASVPATGGAQDDSIPDAQRGSLDDGPASIAGSDKLMSTSKPASPGPTGESAGPPSKRAADRPSGPATVKPGRRPPRSDAAGNPPAQEAGGLAMRPPGASHPPQVGDAASQPEPASPNAGVLRAQVEDRLRGRGLLRGSGSDHDTGITVEVSSEGIVTLRGVVRDPEQRDEAVRLARVAGVSEVRPQINVQRSWK